MIDVITYALLKRYVKDSIAGAGELSGKSAYDIAVENGFVGTEAEWLESLKGQTATISIGENGNWFINGEDTGVSAIASKDMERIDDQKIQDLF